MSNEKKVLGLSAAARVLEDELSRFEESLLELTRPVSSEKSLQRARHALENCAASEQKLAADLQGFAAAMQSIQARHQRCMETLNERAEAIQARHLERSSLVERVALLGQRAREVSEPIASIDEEAWAACTPELLASVHQVSERLEVVISEAAGVATSARESDWADVARDADALKQQLQAVRNRVLIGQRKLASQAPS